MKKGKAFVLVGHENWGKSETLRFLTDDSYHRKYYSIGQKLFTIKRMSNDDVPPDSLINFIKKIDPKDNPLIIITLCPNFNDKNRKTIPILERLSKKYVIYFFILKYKFINTPEVITNKKIEITNEEIENLKAFGEIEIFSNKKIEAKKRAIYFKSFIKKILS